MDWLKERNAHGGLPLARGGPGLPHPVLPRQKTIGPSKPPSPEPMWVGSSHFGSRTAHCSQHASQSQRSKPINALGSADEASLKLLHEVLQKAKQSAHVPPIGERYACHQSIEHAKKRLAKADKNLLSFSALNWPQSWQKGNRSRSSATNSRSTEGCRFRIAQM